MASSFLLSTCCLMLLSLLISPSIAATSPPKPRALLLQVTKDTAKKQYITVLQQRTPAVPVRLAVDLGSRYSWIDCSQNYVSSTFRPVSCKSPLCTPSTFFGCGDCKSGKPRPGCNRNTCSGFATNPYIQTSTGGEISQDSVTIQPTDGINPKGAPVTARGVAFACIGGNLLANLTTGTIGMAAFGRNKLALPTQISSALGVPNKFAICLPSSASNGVIFFGDVPEYHFLLGTVVTPKSLLTTPLLTNPVSTAGVFVSHEPSYEYFINVTGIKVNGNPVAVNTTLLAIAKNTGGGGTKISTVDPYTVLESSIYQAVAGAFTRESGLKKVAPVAPFSACYDATNVSTTRVGPSVPTVELLLQGQSPKSTGWVFFGSNSMVSVRPGVLCLGFVDGGTETRTSIIVGAYQMEDNFLQFDLVGKKVGISGTLLFSRTTCSNFNFTVAA